ncbi:MAG: dihydroorotase [Proteobacteria bacterium]|nr:dihydroorotase [Pseudomonadota bacterium]
MKIKIDNLTIVTSSGLFRRSLLIEKGIIKRVSEKPIQAKNVDFTIENEDLLVFPGFLDMHVHLREPGFEYKEDIESGQKSALKGGFTAVACMANTNPVNDNATVTHYIKCRSKETDLPVDVYPISAITIGLKGEQIVEMGDLKDAGAVAFSDDGNPVENAEILRKAMEYSKCFDMPIICHSEEKKLSKDGQINEGEISLKLGLKGIPRESEIIGIFRDLMLAKLTNARIHIAHVSTKESVNIIRWAKKAGINVTCETCPHYFLLTEEEVLGYNTFAKVNPPLRNKDDILAIREGLKDGTIDVIASDHAPHHIDEKEREFESASFGMIGLETMVPLSLELVRLGVIDFQTLAEKLSRKPHQILRLRPPVIKEGEEANLTIIDPHCEWILEKSNIASKSYNTPFLGKKMKGRAVYTIKGGQVFEVKD